MEQAFLGVLSDDERRRWAEVRLAKAPGNIVAHNDQSGTTTALVLEQPSADWLSRQALQRVVLGLLLEQQRCGILHITGRLNGGITLAMTSDDWHTTDIDVAANRVGAWLWVRCQIIQADLDRLLSVCSDEQPSVGVAKLVLRREIRNWFEDYPNKPETWQDIQRALKARFGTCTGYTRTLANKVWRELGADHPLKHRNRPRGS